MPLTKLELEIAADLSAISNKYALLQPNDGLSISEFAGIVHGLQCRVLSRPGFFEYNTNIKPCIPTTRDDTNVAKTSVNHKYDTDGWWRSFNNP